MKEFTKRHQSRRATLGVFREPDSSAEALAVFAESDKMSLRQFAQNSKSAESERESSVCQSVFNVLSSITLPPPPLDKA